MGIFLLSLGTRRTEPGRRDALHQHSHLQAAFPNGLPRRRHHHSSCQPERPTCRGHHGQWQHQYLQSAESNTGVKQGDSHL